MIAGLTLSLLPIITGILSVISALWCEHNSKYVGEIGSILLIVAALLSVLPPLSGLFIFKKDRNTDATGKARYFSLIPMALSLYSAGYLLLNDIGEWGNAILLLSLAAAIFFILKALDGRPSLKIAGAICLFLFCTAIIGMLYLDFNIELNSPFKVAVQFGAVGMMLGAIADARATLSRISAGWFMLLKSTAASLCLLSAGLIIPAFARGFTILPQTYLTFSLLYAGYAISAIAETIALARSRRKINS